MRCYRCKIDKLPEQFSKGAKACKPCASVLYKEWYARNRERLVAKAGQWARDNKGRMNARKRVTYAANREKMTARARVYNAGRREIVCAQKKAQYQRTGKIAARKWRAKNRSKVLAYRRADARKRRTATPDKKYKWRRANPGAVLANVKLRKAHIKRATPPWANLRGIRTFYEMAARVSKCLGIKHHVDHVAPLRAADSSGLHVEYNLRVIPAVVNLRKGNRPPL